ncbi:MAG: S8 family serine peptidase, partial [Acidobacteriota bacterium]
MAKQRRKSGKKGRSRKKTSKRRVVRKAPPLPPIVYAQASPLSVGGRSLFGAPLLSVSEVPCYVSEDAVLRRAVTQLQRAGFHVMQVGACTVNIAGPPELYESVFSTKLVTEERPVVKPFCREDVATFIDSTDTDIPGLISPRRSRLSELIEGVALEEPSFPFFAHPFAPLVDYWHLRVPGDVSLGVNADKAHRAGVTGRGIKVVMTDTGWYRHSYFTKRGYRSSPVVLGPGSDDLANDEVGHGTGESANLFAVAPDIDFTMVKTNFVNSTGAFNAAIALEPDIISNSWGSDVRQPPLSPANQALAAAIATAVAKGIIVVFSAGNSHFGYPAQHPDVIAAGGVFIEQDGKFRASDYASGFASSIYAGRVVPDVCGLVGLQPRAIYIMLPLEPGDEIDGGNAGSRHPDGDETMSNDGWAAFSGTSAAAPQVAGVCALVKQACPELAPAAVREILDKTARDVTEGHSHPRTGGHPATSGADLATGHGLVDAHKAVMLAKLESQTSVRDRVPDDQGARSAR